MHSLLNHGFKSLSTWSRRISWNTTEHYFYSKKLMMIWLCMWEEVNSFLMLIIRWCTRIWGKSISLCFSMSKGWKKKGLMAEDWSKSLSTEFLNMRLVRSMVFSMKRRKISFFQIKTHHRLRNMSLLARS